MILNKGNFKKKVRFKTIVLEDEQVVDRAAMLVMKKFERKVSEQLFETLCKRLYGFSANIQQEMAYDMLCFIRWQEGYLTGCPMVDYVLAVNYIAIAKEMGFWKEKKQVEKKEV